MKFAVLDFETTGSQPYDEIIQVGLVIIENHSIINHYHTFINPGMPIPGYITQLTGITDEMVQGAPRMTEAIQDFAGLLEDTVLVGHHIAFDLTFLQRSLSKNSFALFDGRVLDTMDSLRILFPMLPSLQLNMVSSSFNIPHERPHQADSDAEATAMIWLKCMDQWKGLPLLTIQRLCALFDTAAQDTADLAWFLQEIRMQKELQTTIDLDAGKYFRQFVVNINDWSDETPAREGHDASDGLEPSFEKFYSDLQQSLQHQFANFEHRKAQEQMIEEVFASLEEERHLLVEAGTGTGKSLGYLIPALYYGIRQHKKIVISTHTIQLQEQLRTRDVPLLEHIFPVPFRAAVLKGRSHYLCLRKFEQKINHHDYEPSKDNRLNAAQMIVWLSETKSGDEEEIHFGNQGVDFWRTVESDTDSCLNRACPWFKKCFYHRARHEANVADVVITNHSLLFTDVKADNRLLPAYNHLVIDEAHHFEEVASKHLGIDTHYFAFVNALSWLFRDSKTGYLPMLRFRLQRNEDEKTLEWCAVIDSFYPKLISVKEEWDLLTEQLFLLLSERNDALQGEIGQYVLRLKPETLPDGWQMLLTMEDNIYVQVSEVLKKLEKLIGELKEEQDEFNMQSLLTDLGGVVKDLYKHRDALRFFMKMSDPDFVYWMEASPTYKSKSLQLICIPTDVSPKLQQYFFEMKDSIIMTSATLSVDKSFRYTSDQLGLHAASESGKLGTSLLPSPFQYREQALVCIPRNFPSVKGSGDTVFIEKLVESLRDVAVVTKGRMLVLFTSYRMLKLAHEALKEQLAPYGIQVLGQGMDSGNRSKLTRLFQDHSACVLLGTSSFWEGVDIPGEALSCLAIVRLPFQPPNHPLIEAKCESIKKQNKNPFMVYSVPQAVIRFKQGFGRLIRTATDRGIVIIYDTRVLDTFYGKYFLYSLPGPKIEHMSTNQMVPRISEWMEYGISIQE